MRFGPKLIPDSLFKLARDFMLKRETFTPAEVREHLIAQAAGTMQGISPIASNHIIIAERVMRACIKQLVGEGLLQPLKRGLWGTMTSQVALSKSEGKLQ